MSPTNYHTSFVWMSNLPCIIHLPAEIVLDITGLLLDPLDLLRLSLTCTQLASVIRQPGAFRQHLRLHGFGMDQACIAPPEHMKSWLGLARTACDCYTAKTHLEDFTTFEDEFLVDDHPTLIRIFAKVFRLIKNPGLNQSFFEKFASKIIEFASGIKFDSEPYYCYDRSFLLACCGYFITATRGEIKLRPDVWKRITLLGRIWSHQHSTPDLHFYAYFQQLYFRFLVTLNSPTVSAVLPRGFERLRSSVALASDPTLWRSNIRTAWTGLSNARVYGCYSYLPFDGSPAGVTSDPNESPMIMTMTTDSPGSTVSATGIDTYGSFSITGTFTTDGLKMEKQYVTHSFIYSGTFLPWGLVGEWASPTPPLFVLGYFYMWIVDS